jgi:hypothetical protein
MPFDLQQLDVPFRMRPGLRKMACDERHLRALHNGSALSLEKQQVADAGQSVVCMPGFDAGAAIDAIWQQAGRDGIATTDQRTEPVTPLALAFEQDLAVLDLASGRVPWMCVCLPSGWAPEEKVGLDLTAIHAPVADSAALATRWPQLARLLSGGASWERHVWTISPSVRYDQHPQRHAPVPWPQADDPRGFAEQCFLRSERQTFFPVRDCDGQLLPQMVFTIDVQLEPLPDVVRDAAGAARLQQALLSMTDAVLAYKRLTTARAPLLAWLSHRATQLTFEAGAKAQSV